MIKISMQDMLLSAMVVAGAIGVTACTDSDYDLNEVDMTVGIGSGELTIPASSTTTIKLSEVLDLEDDGVVEELENGEYRFSKIGDPVDPTDVEIKKISVAQKTSKNIPFDLDLSSAINAAPIGPLRAPSIDYSDSKVVYEFEYHGDEPDEVVSLTDADVNATMDLTLHFSDNLKALVIKITEMDIVLPDYMDFAENQEVQQGELDKENNTLKLKNVSTQRDFILHLKVNRLLFGKEADPELGRLEAADGQVVMEGGIKINVRIKETVTLTESVDPSKCQITSKIVFKDDIVLTEVTGVFDPKIELDDLGSAKVTGIPDFLKEDGVQIDVYNPQLDLTLYSNLTVPGTVKGTIEYKRDGRWESFKLKEPIRIPAAAPGVDYAQRPIKICICRNKAGLAGYDQIIEDDNIKKILYPTIADEISFRAEAAADQVESSFELGRKFTIKPEYKIEAPLALGEDAKIVYTEEFDDWNKDIKDYDLKEGGYIELSTNVKSRIPIHLNVEATPMGLGGVDLSNEVKVEVVGEVAGSDDVNKVVESPVTIKIIPEKGGLKKLDGVKLKISGSAKSENGKPTITGVPLNSKTHNLIADDIVIKLVGTIIADLN